MALARNLRTLIVLGTVASLIATGAIWAYQAVAQGPPECPADWPGQGYEGPLRPEDYGRTQYEDYHTDSDGERWFVIRASDSNGYTVVRAYPAADDAEGGYETDSPDRVCYLIVRKPGQTEDAAEPEQVEFPREQEEKPTPARPPAPSGTATTPDLNGTATPTTPAPGTEDETEPMLAEIEVDGQSVSSGDVVRSGLARGRQVQVTLRVSDPDGDLAYLALVDEDGNELDRVDCADGMEAVCTATVTVTAPDEYSSTDTFRVIAVDDAGVETEVATISLTTRARPSSSGGSSGSTGSRPPVLAIRPPEEFEPFIPNIPAVMHPVVSYRGRHQLSFALIEGPEGMVVDLSDGTIVWVPQGSDAGMTYEITISVSDGGLFVETSFQITVIQSEELATTVEEDPTLGKNALTVTDEMAQLHEMLVTSPPDEFAFETDRLSELKEALQTVSRDEVPPIPSWVVPTTEIFVVNGYFDSPVEIRFPVSELPEGVSPYQFNLYGYGEEVHGGDPAWSSVYQDIVLEGEADDLVLVLRLAGLQGIYFFGYRTDVSGTAAAPGPALIPGRVLADSGPRIEQTAIEGQPRRYDVAFVETLWRRLTSGDLGFGTVEPRVMQQDAYADIKDKVSCARDSRWVLAEAIWGPSPNYVCTYADDAAVKVRINNFAPPNEDIDRWYGVTANSAGRVTALNLGGNELSAKMAIVADELTSLTALTTLDLSDNQLTGEVPAVFDILAFLTSLDLSNNQLTGPIPQGLGTLTGLTTLDLSGNALDGEIPHDMGFLSNLTKLRLGGGNTLEGCIPDGLSSVADNDLSELNLEYCGDRHALEVLYNATGGESWTDRTNWLSATEEITNWHGITVGEDGRVTTLDLQNNNLSGELPVELANLIGLTELKLAGDSITGNSITGCIPDGLRSIADHDLADLGRPYCRDQKALGDVYLSTDGPNWTNKTNWLIGSTDISNWHGVTVGDDGRVTGLDLRSNNLLGSLQRSTARLGSLSSLNLRDNAIMGCLPAGLNAVPDHDLDELNRPYCKDKYALVTIWVHSDGANWTDTSNWPRGVYWGYQVDMDRFVTLEDVASWVIAGQQRAYAMGLGYYEDITVSVESLDKAKGMVKEDSSDVIRLNNNLVTAEGVQGVLFHEYFHTVQNHSDTKAQSDYELAVKHSAREAIGINVFGHSKRRAWLFEGTAEAFVEIVSDEANTYKQAAFPRIMEAGVNSVEGSGTADAYHRVLFFKMLDKYCDGYTTDLNQLLSRAKGFNLDSTWVTQLKGWLSNAGDCDFGDHLGEERSSSLEAALALYNYATLLRRDVNLLDDDADEPTVGFSDPRRLNNGASVDIPAAGAYSYLVTPPSGQPSGTVFQVVVESDREIIVSVASRDASFTGANTIGDDADPHLWFSTGDGVVESVYNYAGGASPEMLVTLVNPSIDGSASVDISTRTRPATAEFLPYPVITSHASDQQVSERVVTVSGDIPSEALDGVTKVVINANGLKTETAMAANGAFSDQVIVFLGDNRITAQAFNGNTPVTEARVITLQGVESTSTGRNVLVPSRVAVVLRWDTDGTDVDIYTTDKDGNTIYFSDKIKDPGFLDVDDVNGFGPEVVSYRAPAHDVYVNGSFDVDVHYFRGIPATNYTLDVILNETEGMDRRLHRYASRTALPAGNSSEAGAAGSGASRFNDILKVLCSSEGKCRVGSVDTSKLTLAGEAGR